MTGVPDETERHLVQTPSAIAPRLTLSRKVPTAGFGAKPDSAAGQMAFVSRRRYVAPQLNWTRKAHSCPGQARTNCAEFVNKDFPNQQKYAISKG